MKRKQITKLFAVMTMAASPAAASPGTQLDPWATSATVSPLDGRDASAAMAAIISIGFAALAQPRMLEAPATPIVAARPRTTPSGAPACGNVATRAPRPVDCAPRSPAILAGTPTTAPTTTTAPQAATRRSTVVATTGGAQ